MLETLPPDVQNGLDAARRRAQRTRGRMQIEIGGEKFVLLRYWDKGFALDVSDAPVLRGHADLYEDGRHMRCCLIVARGREADEMIYEFKRNAPVRDRPARDFDQDERASVALLPHGI